MTPQFRPHCESKCVYLGPYFLVTGTRKQRYDLFLHRYSLDIQGGSRRDSVIFKYQNYNGGYYRYKVTDYPSQRGSDLSRLFDAAMFRAMVKGLLKASVVRDWESRQ